MEVGGILVLLFDARPPSITKLSQSVAPLSRVSRSDRAICVPSGATGKTAENKLIFFNTEASANQPQSVKCVLISDYACSLDRVWVCTPLFWFWRSACERTPRYENLFRWMPLGSECPAASVRIF